MKLKSMKHIMTRLIVSLIAVIVGITLLFTIIRTAEGRSAARTFADSALRASADKISGFVENRLAVFMKTAEFTAADIQSLQKTTVVNRKDIDELLHNHLAGDSSFQGIYSIWEPNAFDGKDSLFQNVFPYDTSGRVTNFWIRNSEGQLIIEPGAPDYETPGDGDYYLIPKREKRSMIVGPYHDQAEGQTILMVSALVPIMQNQSFVGIAGIDMDLKFLQSVLKQQKSLLYDGHCDLSLISAKMIVASTLGDSLLSKECPTELLASDSILQVLEKNVVVVQEKKDAIVVWHSIQLTTADKPWLLSISVPKAIIFAPITASTRDAIILGFILILLSVVYGVWNVRSATQRIVEPIAACVNAAHDAAEGNTKFSIADASIEELHDLVLSFRKMGDSLEKKVSIVEEIAAGNLLVEPEVLSDNDRLGIALVNMVEQLQETLHRISVASISVETGSGHLAQAANALSDGASSQAASIEEIHSSLTEITANANAGASDASDAAKIADKSEEIAREGANHMEALSTAMKEIEKASSAIAKIIKTIEDIAFQTNLLALNAAVEAARAGQHGKGFAVVADEVRTLANRSAKAASETGDLIQITSDKVEAGVKVAKDTEVAFNSIRESVADVAKRISSIAEVVGSQAKGVAEIGIGLDVINQVTQSNTAHAEESASTSQELAMQSVELRSLVGRFRFSDEEPKQYTSAPQIESKPVKRTVDRSKSIGWSDTDY